MARHVPAPLIAAVVALALSACGEDIPTLTIKEGIPGGADPAAARVVDDWSRALADGDVEKAAGFFAIPSVAQNGSAALEIHDRKAARTFNESLPCGAELVRAEGHGGLVLAVFRLIERPGAGRCGDGVGSKAATAFRIENGKIAEWRRVPVPEGGGGAEGPGAIPSDVV